MKAEDAFNPYKSFVITASAGSGKTFQLVERYLRLAAVLEERRLSRILTVTFTRKAAAEMRERILEKAAAVLSDPAARREVEDGIENWTEGEGRSSVAALANHILRNSQSMRVVTMDSLLSWLSGRFSVEAELPFPSEIATPSEQSQLFQIAWFRLINDTGCRPPLEETALLLDAELKPIRKCLEVLYGVYRPTITLHYGDDFERMKREMSLDPEGVYSLDCLERDTWSWLSRLLPDFPLDTPARIATAEELSDCSHRRDLAALLSSAFFKPGGQSWPPEGRHDIAFSVNRSKLPAFLKARADEADGYLRKFRDQRRLTSYNRLIAGLIDLYRAYRSIMADVKRENGLVDFADLAVASFRVLKDPGIAFTLQSGIQHLLIDEFQDTSRLQWEIFRPIKEELLGGSGIYENQSFFAVGDLKQSIYGFREADCTLLEDLADEAERSPRLELLPLHKSFRSSRLIIDFVNAVFTESELSGFSPHDTGVPPLGGSLTVYPLVGKEEKKQIAERFQEDADRIAVSIRGLIEEKIPVAEKTVEGGSVAYRHRPVEYGDIAVLYRKKKCSLHLETALARHGIPCRREEPGGFHQRLEIRDLMAFLDFLCDPEDNLALSAVLRSPLIGMGEKEFSSLISSRGGLSLWKALRRKSEGREILARALADVVRKPLVEVVEEFLQAADARLSYQLSFGDELPALNFDKMIDLLAGLSARGFSSVRECRRALDKMSEEDETRMASSAGNCVRLMTVHKAKGLEFKVLYFADAGYDLPDALRNNSVVQLKHRRPGQPPILYYPPPSCRPEGQSEFVSRMETAEEEARAEELRILYVALTRASQHLFISGVEPGKGEPAFYREMLQGARQLGAGVRWRSEGADPAGEPVTLRLVDPTVLPSLKPPPGAPPEEIDKKIFEEEGRRGGTVFLRPSRSPGEEGETAPEKYRVLGLAVHRAMECIIEGKAFGTEEFLDRVMEKGHPDRTWVAETVRRDLETMRRVDLPSRVAKAEIKTEAAVLDILPGKGEDDRIVTGVVDLLAVFKDRIEFYDYKTARVAPGGEKKKIGAFESQMRLYARALSDIFERPVSGFLVFTATGAIVPVISEP